MGVYIKGMEMPSSCYKCHLRQRNGMDIVCPVAHERFSVADVNILDFRLTNCPLAPVPPHGRLIDADDLVNLLMTFADCNKYSPMSLARWLSYEENTPTIIPAEGVKT